MPDGRVVITDFVELADQTKVTTALDAAPQNPFDMQTDGWQAIMNNFKNYVESN